MGKLKGALIAEKGIDMKKHALQRKLKAAQKAKDSRKRKLQDREDKDDDNEDWEDDEEEGQGGVPIDAEDSDEEEADVELLEAINDSGSDSEIEMEERIQRKPNGKSPKKKQQTQEEQDEDDEEEDDEEEDIPLSDLESLPEEDREDLIPHQRLSINNVTALLSSLNRIRIPTDSAATFASHMCIQATGAPTEDTVEDVQDDLTRELAFYSQAQTAAREARRLLLKEGVPFTRPGDFFAEMVKDDGHMDKVKARLIEVATNKKAAADARKQRDLKKFGKQVQSAKIQERAKQKRDALDKIKSLKKKRSESGAGGTKEADLFDVAIDNEVSKPGSRKRGAPSGAPGDRTQPSRMKRQKKDEKFGFGGKKRNSKSGDAMSSGDVSGFNNKKMKSTTFTAKRPGKARRKNMGGRK